MYSIAPLDERRKHRRPSTGPLSFTDSDEDGFILRGTPLGIPPTDALQFNTSLAPRTQHPARMIIFEIRYHRIFAINRKCCPRPRQIVRQSTTRLEIGIKKSKPSAEPPQMAIPKPVPQLTPQVPNESLGICDRVYELWLFKRSFCDPANAKIDLYLGFDALADNMMGQKTVFWRYDDDDCADADFLDDGWDLSALTRAHPEPDKSQAHELVKYLAKEDRSRQADLFKQLEVGDSLGVWVRMRDGPSISMIEGVKMHVFWAAS